MGEELDKRAQRIGDRLNQDDNQKLRAKNPSKEGPQ